MLPILGIQPIQVPKSLSHRRDAGGLVLASPEKSSWFSQSPQLAIIPPMHWAHYRPSKKAVFWSLMLVSALTVFLPPRITELTKHTTQLLTPLQDLARFVTFQARVPAEPTVDPVDSPIARELASKTVQISQLRDDLARMQSIHDLSITAALQAHVVAWDIASMRDSAVIERGSELGVRSRDWVATRLVIDRGETAGLRAGDTVIAQESLLGRVELVSPYMSRVKLLSDVDSEPVYIRFAGLRDGEMRLLPTPATLHGMGRGQMIVRDVKYDLIETAGEPGDGMRIRIGDLVTSSPGEMGLPVPLVIGRVVEIRQDPKQRLVYDVIVEAGAARDSIRYVHVIPLVPNAVAME